MSPTPASPGPNNTPTARRPSSSSSTAASTCARRGQPGAQRWRSLAEGIDAHISADPFWPRLATHLDAAARAGADVSALLTDAVERHGPLPDELPAAALWWRLAGTLEPPTLAAANTGCARPGHRTAPPARLAHRRNRHRRPGVAIAGHRRRRSGEPRDLLTAAEHLRDIDETEHLRPDEYARLLTYRVELLTHHAATIDADIPHPAEAAERSAPAEPGERLDLFNDVEAPPDPHDYPYSYADDTLDGLDFTDLPRHRPSHSAPGSTPTSPPRAQRAAHQHAAHLAQATARPRPAEVAAAGRTRRTTRTPPAAASPPA